TRVGCSRQRSSNLRNARDSPTMAMPIQQTFRPSIKSASGQTPSDSTHPSFWVEKQALHSSRLPLIGGVRPELLFERFGILENPFGVTPDPRYLYQSRSH